MTYDSETFRQQASTLSSDADAEVAGHLALAYAALERRRHAEVTADVAGDAGDQLVLVED